MPWLIGLDRVRDATRRAVPSLIGSRRLPPLGRLATTVRHLGGAIAAWWLVERRREGPGTSGSKSGLSRRVREAAEILGPTYIKLAQIISAGEGVFPDELVTEFQKCRDQVAPEPFDTVLATIRSELGRPPEEVFSHIEPTALAAASIAQVHRATLLTGEEVVIKVQRSTVGRRVGRDLRVLAWLAPFLVGRIPVSALANPPALVELFAETITEELDFRLEAQNLLDVARVLEELDQTDWVIPRPHPDLVSPRMLVMEKVEGFAFNDVAAMKEAGIDTHRVVRNVMISFLESATLHGVFHGDFHGGNLFVRPDGKVALLDFGITGRMDEFRRRAFLRMMMSAIANDTRGQMAALRDLGALPRDADIDQVIADLGLEDPIVDPTSMDQEQLLAEMQRVVKAMLGYGARMPKTLMLYVKNMIFLSSMIGHLAPDIDLIAEVQSIAMHFAMTHGQQIARDSGMVVDADSIDMTGIKASMGLEADVESLTWAELRARRELIIKRMGEGRR
ncbi:MAG TPA: AarF/ABC1/UbiB kinase family protein [Acidimicrobiales bacterium]|nr:AarF/ABC1/UbiB kinase family protein [Acidimicrobiales bacterium]